MAKALEAPWKKCFDDLSQRQDTKTRPNFSAFQYRKLKESAPWFDQELIIRGPGISICARSKKQCHSVRMEGISDIVSHLKACAKQKDLGSGSMLHTYVQEHGLLEENCFIASALINMYARCGALAKAQQVFNDLPISVRGVVAWNALIAGYVQHGESEEALKCFDRMQHEGQSPDVVTFTCALKACGNIRSAVKGEQIHDRIVNLGILDNIVLGSTLVDMYAKCASLEKAQEVFSQLPERDVIAWTTLIAGYTQQGQGEKALTCFDSMQREGQTPDAVTFTCALKACGSVGALTKGEQIHDRLVSLGLLDKNIMLGNTLVDMYARCGALAKARRVLDELPVRGVAGWTSLIARYAEEGQDEEALKCFDSMQHEGHSPDAVTFTCALKACGSIGAVMKAEQIYDKIVTLGMLDKNVMLGSSVVDMYAKFGALQKAKKVFDQLSVRDEVAWTSLISGYVQQGQDEEALKCFDSMRCEGHSPDTVTFICALKACGSLRAITKGEQIHDKIVCLGILEKHVVLGNTLVDMYAKCGVFAKAQQVLDELPVRNVVTWTSLIAGHMLHGQGEEALECVDAMQLEGHSPNAVTLTCAVKACGSLAAVAKGELMHKKIVSLGLLEKNIELGNALVDMYARCGALPQAQQVFSQLTVRDVSSWTALIAGYAQLGQGEEALKCFDTMQHVGHSPDAITFTYALKACGSIGTVDKGEQIHDNIENLGLFEQNLVLASALVDMYVSCAAFLKAKQVFDQLHVHDVVAWTAMIAGYAKQGQGRDVLNCFERMQSKGIRPSSATLVSVLNACSHSGQLDHAKMLFSRMSTEYGIIPNAEHYSCMVDIFARAGKLEKALIAIEKMLSVDHLPFWLALMGACFKWGDVKIGRLAFEHAIRLDKNDAAAYVCMANIYTAAGMQEDAEKIKAMRLGS